jgi:maleate isomerase
MKNDHILRIGLLVPSSNTAMEPDLYKMIPKGITVHTAHMGLEKVTSNGLKEMSKDAMKASKLLESADVDIIVFGCTSGSLVGGVEWEKKLVERIMDNTGIPTITTGCAVVDAIKIMGGKRLGVATPYTNELNMLEKIFLKAYGFEILKIKGLGLVNNLEIGKTSEETILRLVNEIEKNSDLIFISCTNLPTISLIDKLEQMYNKPVVTSNQASMWAALRSKVLTKIIGFGRLLREY